MTARPPTGLPPADAPAAIVADAVGARPADGETAAAPAADAVVAFLRAHPGFLDEHPALLAEMRVAHETGGHAVSLVERQVEVLRQRHRALEARMAALLRHGEENDAIAARMHAWTRPLLHARDPADVPERVALGLRERFSVPLVALRLWRVDPSVAERDFAQPVDDAIRAWSDGQAEPYCGPTAAHPTAQDAARWLDTDGPTARSVALLPLRVGASPAAFGLLVLGSADPQRFDAGMSTEFLARIAEIASAALSRLVPAGH